MARIETSPEERVTPESEAMATADDPTWVRAIDRVSRLFCLISAAMCFVMMLNVVLDVVGRSFFNRPVNGTLEYVTYWWMPLLVFFALALTQLRGEHISVSLLVDAVSPRIRRVLEVSALVVSLVLTAVLVFYGWLGADAAMTIQQAALGTAVVPIWPIKLLAVVGLATFALQLIASIVRTVRAPLGDADPVLPAVSS